MPCLILKTRRETCSQPKTPRFQMIFGKGERSCTFRTTLQASIFHKSVEISAFWHRYRSIRIDNFPQRVSMAIFIYNQKPFVRRRLRRCRLRHKIRAIKTRQNNPLRFLQRKNSIRRYLANDLTFSSFAKRRSEQENVFTTNNTHPNQKINRLNQTALILTQDLTTATLQCTVSP